MDDVHACVNLGAFLADGAAGPKDAVGADQLFTRGCDANDAIACKLLGDAFAKGEGVAKDTKRARELYDKACRGGNQRACGDLDAGTR